MLTHILVAIDGSDGSRRAAYYARDLAAQTSARLTLLIAIEPPTAVTIPPFDAVSFTSSHPSPEHIAAAQTIMDEVAASLPDVHTRAVIGHPVPTICAEGEGADLIVLGARGVSAAERMFLGSVSERVVREAGRPVLVVP